MTVQGASDLVGKSLGDSGLRERDISALTLQRGTSVIPNPNSSHVLEAGDRLLCFGKLEEMRSMIPSRRKRSKRIKRLPDEPIHEVAAPPAD
ncbi:cation:proton antiporter regulatory subunit [Nocardioides sp.]|uniref:cation:proton antiporter regulatory subunit n=1 Tax=Nocardioides sp. TaxID=35761 RepID=UPI003A5BB35C